MFYCYLVTIAQLSLVYFFCVLWFDSDFVVFFLGIGPLAKMDVPIMLFTA